MMSAIASQITGVSSVCSAFSSGTLKRKSKLRVTGLCEGNPPFTGGFPSENASNVENASIWWRHHVLACLSEYIVVYLQRLTNWKISLYVSIFMMMNLHQCIFHFCRRLCTEFDHLTLDHRFLHSTLVLPFYIDVVFVIFYSISATSLSIGRVLIHQN